MSRPESKAGITHQRGLPLVTASAPKPAGDKHGADQQQQPGPRIGGDLIAQRADRRAGGVGQRDDRQRNPERGHLTCFVAGLAPLITNALLDGFTTTNRGSPAVIRISTSSAVSLSVSIQSSRCVRQCFTKLSAPTRFIRYSVDWRSSGGRALIH